MTLSDDPAAPTDHAFPTVLAAAGHNAITEGTLVEVLTYVYWHTEATAVELVRTARDAGVLEELRPGVLRVTEQYRTTDRQPRGP